jgi:hypothetical protein
MTTTKFKALTLCSLAALLAAGQAFAHTGVRDQATEATSSYNGFTITHGCADYNNPTDVQYPVIGQSAVFPFGPYAIWRNADGTLLQEGGNGNGTISSATLDLKVTGYQSMSSPFRTSQEIVDEAGTVQALIWKDGAMEPKLNAITPFKITPPTIVNNCTRLKIRVGVINYCDVNKNADNDVKGPYKAPKDAFGKTIPWVYQPGANASNQINVNPKSFYKTTTKGNGDNNRADWWFRDLYYNPAANSAVYNDQDILSEAGLWSAVITVNNSQAQLETCPKDANGNPVVTDVIVEPSGAAFDKFLSGANTRPFTLGDTNL